MSFIRKWVQGIFVLLINGSWSFPFTKMIYRGPLKVICSPGLNCYSCPASTTYCPIGAFQQLMGGVRMAVQNGQYFFGFYIVGTIGVIGAFVGRMICGWACPFGLIQELLHKIPSRKFGVPGWMRYIKFVILPVMVFILPLMVVDKMGLGDPWFCKYLCPAGTLEAGLPLLFMQPTLRATVGWLFFNKLMFLTLFVLWSIPTSRPFCRTTCPLGAFYALFSKVKMIKLHLDPELCTNCQACHKVCPMGVKFNESPDDTECISCMACVKACDFGAIQLEAGGMPLAAFNCRSKLKKQVS